jgi:hypothetical protein
MLSRRAIVLLAATLLLLAPAAGALAAGSGIPAGPALLFPSLSITETHDDNIRLSSDDKIDDWITSVAPSLRLVLPVRRFFLEAEGGLDFVDYKDTSSEDSTNWFVGATGGADFPGGLSFKIGDTHARQFLHATQEFGTGEYAALNTLRASAAYAIRDALRLEGSWLRNQYTYDRSKRRERTENTLQADLYWKFRPRVSALVEAAFSDYAYDSNTAQDGSATQLAAGLTWDVTAKSTGFAKAGYQWKRYDEESRVFGTENGNYFTLAVGVRHSFTQRTSAEVAVSRASFESDFPDNPYFLRTALDATLAQRFTAKLYGRARLRLGVDEYPNETSYVNPYDPFAVTESGTRDDKTLAGKLTLGFDVTRWLALEAAYGVERRNSNFDTFDYTDHQVSLSATAAF